VTHAHASDEGTDGAHLGARAGLGESAWQWGRRTVRRSVGCLPADAQREEGADSEAALGLAWLRGTSLGKARGGSNIEAAYDARAGTLARWSAGDVASA
jgi:hypothetical protein